LQSQEAERRPLKLADIEQIFVRIAEPGDLGRVGSGPDASFVPVRESPEELYESLRKRARSNRRSISAETIFLLERALSTAAKQRRRDAVYQRIQRLSTRPGAVVPGPSTEQLLREDRER
jgi:hypothetical protein